VPVGRVGNRCFYLGSLHSRQHWARCWAQCIVPRTDEHSAQAAEKESGRTLLENPSVASSRSSSFLMRTATGVSHPNRVGLVQVTVKLGDIALRDLSAAACPVVAPWGAEKPGDKPPRNCTKGLASRSAKQFC